MKFMYICNCVLHKGTEVSSNCCKLHIILHRFTVNWGQQNDYEVFLSEIFTTMKVGNVVTGKVAEKTWKLSHKFKIWHSLYL